MNPLTDPNYHLLERGEQAGLVCRYQAVLKDPGATVAERRDAARELPRVRQALARADRRANREAIERAQGAATTVAPRSAPTPSGAITAQLAGATVVAELDRRGELAKAARVAVAGQLPDHLIPRRVMQHAIAQLRADLEEERSRPIAPPPRRAITPGRPVESRSLSADELRGIDRCLGLRREGDQAELVAGRLVLRQPPGPGEVLVPAAIAPCVVPPSPAEPPMLEGAALRAIDRAMGLEAEPAPRAVAELRGTKLILRTR